MIRVTNNLLANNFMTEVNTQRAALKTYQDNLASGYRINRPHQDPSGAAKSMQFRQMLGEYNRYETNAAEAKDRLNFTDGKLQETVDYLNAIREYAVQGATGTYTQDDLQALGSQVEQLLRQIINVANAKHTGESIFAGHRIDGNAFHIEMNRIPEYDAPVVTQVRYTGDIGNQFREIDRGEYLEVNLPGNRVFWANHFRITSQTSATNYAATRDQVIAIDGMNLDIHQGDTVEMIVDKINAADIAVRAEIDNTTGMNFIALQATEPHQIVLEDLQGGQVLQDLGLIVAGAGVDPVHNYAPSAIVDGDSVFDKVMQLRDSLYAGDSQGVNRAIGGVDEALENVLAHTATLGSRAKRAEMVENRVAHMKMVTEDRLADVSGTDMPKTITELKNMELMHQMTLQVGARLIPRTLLDYLR
jgi:flagellar hook-associated protein 3 FlgL